MEVKDRAAVSGCGSGGLSGFVQAVHCDWLQLEGVIARRNHRHREWGQIRPVVEVFGLKPGAKPGIANLRLVLPKARPQPTLDLEMIQLQLYDRNLSWKVTPDIGDADVQSGQTAALALCFDHHNCLPFNVR